MENPNPVKAIHDAKVSEITNFVRCWAVELSRDEQNEIVKAILNTFGRSKAELKGRTGQFK